MRPIPGPHGSRRRFAPPHHEGSDRVVRARAEKRLLLAFRAPEGGAPVLSEAPDDPAAAGRAACFAFAVVDLEGMLEIAELAIGLAMVAQRLAGRLDRLVQHLVDRFDQSLRTIVRLAFSRCDRSCLP